MLKNYQLRFLYCLFVLAAIIPQSTFADNEIPVPYPCRSVEWSTERFPVQPFFKAPPPENPLLIRSMKNATVLIPVVVHLVYNDNNTHVRDITDEIVQDQIEVLNEDFGRYGNGFNDHPAGADTRIRFALVQQDENGNPTNGIYRHHSDYTDLNSNLEDVALKSSLGWNASQYLNIYVVSRIDNGQVSGYAYLPPGWAGTVQDGIVIDYIAFGRDEQANHHYSLGRILTHEAGHYLNLLHPWGPGTSGDCSTDDGIHDTPNCEGPLPIAFYPECPAPVQCGNVRMIENYMDYSDTRCMNIFTRGQRSAMREAIFQFRTSLISYGNIVQTGLADEYAAINNQTREISQVDIFPNPVRSDQSVLNIYAVYPESAETSFRLMDLTGREHRFLTHGKLGNEHLTISVDDLPPGQYILHIERGDEIHKRIIAIQ